MKWIDEKVFQKYFKEQFKKYNPLIEKVCGKKLISVSFNKPFDKYPDIWGVLEDGQRVPIEVEWTTKDFNHDPTIIQQNNGFIVVLQNNIPTFGLKQVELDKNHFKLWYNKNSDKIFEESISKVIVPKEKIKRPPKLWFYYSSSSSHKNRQKTLESGTMGVTFKFRQILRYKDVRVGDLFCIIGPYKNMTNGRLSFEEFKKEKKIICSDLLVFKVKRGYYYDESIIWDHQVSYLDFDRIRNYPHRFDFNKKPIVNLSNIKVRPLTETSKRDLHKLPYTIFWDGDSDVLIDLIGHSK